jgi:hypothetical protein
MGSGRTWPFVPGPDTKQVARLLNESASSVKVSLSTCFAQLNDLNKAASPRWCRAAQTHLQHRQKMRGKSLDFAQVF